MEASGDTAVHTVQTSSAKGERLIERSKKLTPSRVSLKIAGDEKLSTCNASDQRNRERVVLDLFCQTFNGQDQVVTVGELLVHMRTLSLSPSPLLSRLSHLTPECGFTTPCVHSKRLRVYQQHVHMFYLRGRVASTHGMVLNVHTEGLRIYTWRFCSVPTTYTTSTNTTHSKTTREQQKEDKSSKKQRREDERDERQK